MQIFKLEKHVSGDLHSTSVSISQLIFDNTRVSNFFWSTLSYLFYYKRVYQRCRATGLERGGRETEEKGIGKQKDRRKGKKEIHKTSRRKRGCRLCSPCDVIISIPEIMENNTTPDIFHENFSRTDRKEGIYRDKVIQRESEGGLSIHISLTITIWPQPCTVICYCVE